MSSQTDVRYHGLTTNRILTSIALTNQIASLKWMKRNLRCVSEAETNFNVIYSLNSYLAYIFLDQGILKAIFGKKELYLRNYNCKKHLIEVHYWYNIKNYNLYKVKQLTHQT